jgi:ATP-dependent helicase/nuclease subunit A
MKPGEILSKHLMILASAGSGKTYQLGNRVIGLVAIHGHKPEKIVALTFTRKAAGEFADAVLLKLAAAAISDEKAGALWQELGGRFEVMPVLEAMVQAMPRLQFGTMDSFFARVVQAYQYELGISSDQFELLEGAPLEVAQLDILQRLLGGDLSEKQAEEFMHAFRRATQGQEGLKILSLVQKFLKTWHRWWKVGALSRGGRLSALFPSLPDVREWEAGKHYHLAKIRPHSPHDAFTKLLDAFEQHTVGSGIVARDGGTLFMRLLEQVPDDHSISFDYKKKEYSLDAFVSEQVRSLYRLLAACELAAAVHRTEAIADLVQRFDFDCERQLRRRGQLSFDDVKILMGRWAKNEEDRIRREWIDFRLDARYDHWLLDEFQDTSPEEWLGLWPLLHEASQRDDGTIFIVGDKKQAIYGWRGGDVALFDLAESHIPDMQSRPMPESWRSCPAVLELVNQVCGNKEVIRQLFGKTVADKWIWDEHTSAKPKLTGEARVELVAKEDQTDRLIKLLREIGVGERQLSCGVLVRKNDQVREIAAILREHGFDVVEDGRRVPTQDHVVGVALLHWVAWLADPSDSYARELLGMSPLGEEVRQQWGGMDATAWEKGSGLVAEFGFAEIAGRLLKPQLQSLSRYGQKRADEVIRALAEFDASGKTSAREAFRRLDGLELPQNPGAAAVQVMTIHKSKGLGFDVVVLPDMEDKQVPDGSKYGICRGFSEQEEWLLDAPPSWVRKLFSPLAAAQTRWEDEQRYEAMCLLYVALTRAKRGLYVFLPELPKTRKGAESWSSAANWLRQTVGEDFQAGDKSWYSQIEPRREKPMESHEELAAAVQRREQLRPSNAAHGGSGRAGKWFGSEVHRLLQCIDQAGALMVLTDGPAGECVKALLENEVVRARFELHGEHAELLKEQPVDVLLDGKWLSGVMDRLHVYRDAAGEVVRIEIMEYKTDRVDSAQKLIQRHGGQISAYARAMRVIHPKAEIQAWLLSTHMQQWFSVELEEAFA